jgi:hypothetical protein
MNWLDAVLIVLLVSWILAGLKGGISLRFDTVFNVLPSEFGALRDFFGDSLRTIAG